MRQLLSVLRKNNIQLKLVEGELSIKIPKGKKIDEDILATIKSQKKDLIDYLETLNKQSNLNIPAIDQRSSYPLSSSQRSLWVLSQFEEGNISNNMPSAYVFEGNLNHEALENSFATLIERHENLRTVFKEDENGEVKQFIQSVEYSGFKIAYQDLRAEKDQKKKIEELTQLEFTSPFDLVHGPLIRSNVYQVTDTKWIFMYVMHHIISDGWSMEILIKELLQFYNEAVIGEVNLLTPLRIHYKDYACWQQAQLSGEALKNHKTYWLNQLAGELPVLDLAGDKIRPIVKTYNGETIYTKINSQLTNGIKSLSHAQGGTLFMGLLAAVNTLLYRYTNQEDIIIGSLIAGREHEDLEDQIGFYVNTLALRMQFKGSNNYNELLQNAKQVTLGAYEHQVYPFDELVDALQLQRDISRNPLFDVLVVLQNATTNATGETFNLGELQVKAFEGEQAPRSKFDLLFNFTEIGEELQMSIGYNTDIYTKHTVERLIIHLEQLLEAMIASPEQPINELSYLTEKEKQQLLETFNDTTVAYPNDKTIVTLFEEQVKRTPESIALVFENKQLTYKQLDEKSNQLAHYIKSHCAVKSGDLVGMMLDRSEKTLVAILGILKSGAAYVPIDLDYPKLRKEHIINDTGIKVLITQSEHEVDLDFAGSIFKIDVQLDALDTSVASISSTITSSDLAYIMYTSGSMGTPKGVMVEHRSIVRLVQSTNFVNLSAEEVLLSTGAVSFDATTFEYWSMLLNGGRLVMSSKEVLLDANQLASAIKENGVTMMWFTAGWLNQLVDTDIELFSGLKTLLAGGDKLSPVHINALLDHYPSLKIVNGYGPTENTTFSLTYGIDSSITTIPVGSPINNSTAYILDEFHQLLPIGVVGEICVGGIGLARGYLNNDDLTQSKFIAHPFKSGERMYKTGDLGRWLPDGNIEFIGRKDAQVKIRGYRIELGEIESALQNYPQIDAAVVIAKATAHDEKELVVYLVSKVMQNIQELRLYLSTTLPSYMVPNHYVQLEELPLNSNGKVDRKQLPDPEGLGITSSVEYVAPRNEIEEKLVVIWQELLGKEKIGVIDNFFELGGHSLKATRLTSQIHKVFDVKISLLKLFENPTIENIANEIEKTNLVNNEIFEMEDAENISI